MSVPSRGWLPARPDAGEKDGVLGMCTECIVFMEFSATFGCYRCNGDEEDQCEMVCNQAKPLGVMRC